MELFRNRVDAGRQLAARLEHRLKNKPVVLALPRGGVPVAAEIARALNAPLDLVIVRKIGVPWQPELAVGAIADCEPPEIVLNDEVIREAGVDQESIARVTAAEKAEIERRRKLYLQGRRPAEIAGHVAIVVDDGIATGATTRAALLAVRRRSPAQLILAVPVAPPSTLARLRPLVDEIVCLRTPEAFYAIGAYYADFHQVSDAEVTGTLAQAARRVESAASE